MILFIILTNVFTGCYVIYQIKIATPVKYEMDMSYVDGLIEKALRETENDIK